MVVFEIASAVIMLSSAGLLLRSFWQLQAVRSGVFEPERILTATIRLPPVRYQTAELIVNFYSGRASTGKRPAGLKPRELSAIYP